MPQHLPRWESGSKGPASKIEQVGGILSTSSLTSLCFAHIQQLTHTNSPLWKQQFPKIATSGQPQENTSPQDNPGRLARQQTFANEIPSAPPPIQVIIGVRGTISESSEIYNPGSHGYMASASCLTSFSLSLDFFVCKMGAVVIPLTQCGELNVPNK